MIQKPVGALFLLICTLSAAQAKTEMIGPGSQKCPDFLRVAQAKQGPQTAVYVAWAQGFGSAMNLSRGQRNLPTKQFSQKDYGPEEQLAYLVTYCRNNPKMDFASATIDMYRRFPIAK